MPLPEPAARVINFWVDLGPAGWYAGGADLDAQIRDMFLEDWKTAADGGHRDWLCGAQGTLAFLILTDQFPRNMFRGEAGAFSTDPLAKATATRAWQHGLDLKVEEPLRQFFYVPLMHSESVIDQDRCVCLMKARMPMGGPTGVLHARAHREIIRKFGRFPFRNEALGRQSTPQEAEFLANGGYGEIVRTLQS